jgi:2'-hydroxyisoflavone reductase
LFPSLEHLTGDRRASDGLAALRSNRAWDAVIDVWPNEPEIVEPAAHLLAERVPYYYFVSSIGAYKNYERIGMDETAPTRLERPGYGGNKARSEAALATLIPPDRLGIARPHGIYGRRGADGPSYLYWLSKLATQDEILAPGDGTDVVEYVDVLDVAAWVVDCVEHQRGGIFNVFSRPTPWRTFLEESRRAVGGRATLVWVDDSFIAAHGVRSEDNLPYWNYDKPGFARISPEKIFRTGWSPRPLLETAKDAWDAYQHSPLAGVEFPQAEGRYEWGISREKERAILEDWRRRSPT